MIAGDQAIEGAAARDLALQPAGEQMERARAKVFERPAEGEGSGFSSA